MEAKPPYNQIEDILLLSEGKVRTQALYIRRNGESLTRTFDSYAEAETWHDRITGKVAGHEAVDFSKERAHRTACLDAASEAALIEAAAQSTRPWLVWCVRLALATAMRAGEIRRLEWRHIHDSHIHLPQTKNDTARDVPLTTAAARVVAEIRVALPQRSDDFVFDQDAVTKAALSYQYKQAHDRAIKNHHELDSKLIYFRFHDGRHVDITRLAKLHKNILELAATTGHKTLNVLNIYYNPTPEERAAEIRAKEAELEAALAHDSAPKPRKVRRAKGGNVVPIRCPPRRPMRTR